MDLNNRLLIKSGTRHDINAFHNKQVPLTTNRDDIALLKGCLKQDRASQRKLFDRFSGKMLGVCYRYMASLDDAEDVLQDGFIKVFRELNSYNASGSLEGWIRRIMINTALDHLKKQKKIDRNEDIDVVADHVEDIMNQPNLDGKDILKLVNMLPDDYRIIINLYAIEGYSHTEIAGMMGIEEGSSRSRLSRGRTLLKRLFENFYVTNDKYQSK